MKRLRKSIGDRILVEEVKNEDSKKRSQIKSSTNESAFKNPAHHTPPKKHNGGSTSGMTSGSRDTNSNISNVLPQSQMSPGIDQRMQNIQLGLGGKK